MVRFLNAKLRSRRLIVCRCSRKVDAFHLSIDMDSEKGRPSRDNEDNTFRVQIRGSKEVNLYALDAYLKGHGEHGNDVTEAISE